jgi:hypothetical protein
MLDGIEINPESTLLPSLSLQTLKNDLLVARPDALGNSLNINWEGDIRRVLLKTVRLLRTYQRRNTKYLEH